MHLIPTIPYVTLVMAGVYSNYDIAYEEQARVLGAPPLRVLLRVTLPAVAPGLAVAALFAFLISWSEYILTLLIGGGTVKTLPLLLFSSLGHRRHREDRRAGAGRHRAAGPAAAADVPPPVGVAPRRPGRVGPAVSTPVPDRRG